MILTKLETSAKQSPEPFFLKVAWQGLAVSIIFHTRV